MRARQDYTRKKTLRGRELRRGDDRRRFTMAAWGAFLGMAVVATVLAAGLAGLKSASADPRTTIVQPTLLLITSHGPSGSDQAVMAVEVDHDGRAWLVDPAGSLQLPDVSDVTLRDAPSFTTGRGIATALGLDEDAHYAEADATALSASGTADANLSVDIPRAIDAYDAYGLHSYDAGVQALRPADIAPLVNASAYLPAAERRRLLSGLARATLAALAVEAPQATDTDMSPAEVSRVAALAASAPNGPILMMPRSGGAQ